MNRFFIKEEQRIADRIFFSEEVSHQIKRVLRLQEQDQVLCPNGLGQTYWVALADMNGKQAVGNILKTFSESTEPQLQMTLIQGLPKGERWDFILQKATELGVHLFQPVLSERTIVHLNPGEVAKKTARWQKIVQEAAEQSHREICPIVAPVLQLHQWLKSKSEYDLLLLAWEEEKACSLRSVLQQNPNLKNIALIVGPEGGFSQDEAKLMQEAGAVSVSLGPRILRTETAALALAAMVMFHFGQMEV